MRSTQLLFTSPLPKSDISDFGQLKVPNSRKPEFGWGEVGMGASCAPIPGEGVRNQHGAWPPHPDRASAIRPLPYGERC